MRPPDPREIARRAAERDTEAFAMLYQENLDTVYRFVFFKVSNHAVAEDVTADVFAKAWANIERFEWRNLPFQHWLLRIARNAVIDYWRSSKPTRSVDELYDTASGEVSPDDAVVRDLESERLRRAMEQLPDEQRDVLLLRFVEGFSHADVAAVLGKSVVAVRQIQVRALQRLKKILSDEGPEPGVERSPRGPRPTPRPNRGPAEEPAR
jgi:RNA polymerase sigma-70 factor, ECF subfamily